MDWVRKHFRQIIYISFLFPIILVAIVSISHVTEWYSIGNPISWAIYLSVAVEVAALSSLAAIVGKLGKRVYFPFILVTFIQFIGNVFFTYQWIDVDSELFLDWVEMTSPIMTLGGVESTDLTGHQRILAFLGGGLLPLISLTFLGLLVRFEEQTPQEEMVSENPEINAKDLIGEISKVRLDEDELNKIDEKLKNIKPKTKEETIKKWKDVGFIDNSPPSETPKPTPSETPKPTPSETPEPTPDATPEPTPSETPEPTPDATPEPTPSETPEPTPSETPKPTPNATPEPTPSETPKPTPSETPKPTPSETPKPTPNATPEPTPSETPKPTPWVEIAGQDVGVLPDVKKKILKGPEVGLDPSFLSTTSEKEPNKEPKVRKVSTSPVKTYTRNVNNSRRKHT